MKILIYAILGLPQQPPKPTDNCILNLYQLISTGAYFVWNSVSNIVMINFGKKSIIKDVSIWGGMNIKKPDFELPQLWRIELWTLCTFCSKNETECKNHGKMVEHSLSNHSVVGRVGRTGGPGYPQGPPSFRILCSQKN